MAENSQLSDETKNNSTDTSSTDASSAVIGNHENAIVPHKISNHDKLVQTMVMVDGEWINVNDTNDQANMKEDMHKVNKKVVEAQKGIVEAKNAADSAVKYADSAVSASKVNSDAIAAQSSAISEAKAAADDAASKAQAVKENAASEAAAIRNQVADVANNVSSVKADVASATSDVANLKVDVQANSAAIIKTNDAVKIQSKNSSDAINELKIANGQVESIAKDAKNNATVAKQTADAATIVAQDAKSNAVVAKQTASSATIEATNATSTASKAELSVNGLTTRVDGIEGDTKKLSGRVTSTETILQQTKDQLLQKADKSVVDQANNLISQLSAEQKTMAGQISQKVSSAEYQTLRDKVNGMNGGGKNLLKGTRDFDSKYWYCSDSSHSVLADNPVDSSVKEIHSYGDWASFRYNQTIQLDPNKNYMISADIAVYGNDGNGLYITAYGNLDGVERGLTNDVNLAGFPKQQNGEGFKRVYLPLKTHGKKLDTFRIEGHGNWNAGEESVFISKIALYEGNTQQGWEDSSDDLIESIQKNSTAIDQTNKQISLKADQTEVDKIKNTASQNSSRLDVMANEIKSKVDGTTVNNILDSKGYATMSYAQTLVKQTKDQWNVTATDLDTKIKSNNGGGINLLKATDFSSTDLTKLKYVWGPNFTLRDGKAMQLDQLKGNGDLDATQFLPVEPDTDYTLSFEVYYNTVASGGSYNNIYTFIVEYKDQNNATPHYLDHMRVVANTADRSKNIQTIHTQKDCHYVRVFFRASAKTLFSFWRPKLERGSVATPWSPAPSDLATVTQISSRLDVMNNEIKSKVSSTDVNNIVDSKGYATTSTVQSLVDQKAGTINESIVKLSGKVNNNNGGGINLLKATDFANTDMDTLRKYWGSSFTIRDGVALQVDGLALKSGSADATQVVQVDPDTDYTLSFEVHNNAVADGGNWNKIQTFLWEFKDSETRKATDKYTDNCRSVVNTNKRNDNIQTIHTQPDCHYIIVIFRANPKVLFSFVKPKLERGSVATPWSPAPSDLATVTQISNLQVSIDGIQGNVNNLKNDTSSRITQLSNTFQSKIGNAQISINDLKDKTLWKNTDSVDLNNVVTQQKIFVRGGSNLPPGSYWWYVQVEPGYDSRIVQYAVSDRDNLHYSRQYDGSKWSAWSQGATESEITQLRDDINLRVTKGDLLSQINVAAGRTLIQSNKIYFDADTFVMSPNSKAFIPSAYITNINADKITTGTLDAAKFNVKNFSADSITSGTLDGIKFKTEFTNDNGISIMGDRIAWTSMTSFGEQLNGWIENSTQEIDWLSFRDLRLQSVSNIAIDTKGTDDVTRWSIADYDHYDQPGLMSSNTHKFIPEEYRYDESGDADQSNAVLLASANTYVAVRRRTGVVAHLDSKFFNEDSTFAIQKDNKIGAYFGSGDNGNELNVTTAGNNNHIAFNTSNFDIDGEVNIKNNHGLTAKNVHVTGWLGVDGSKNSIVRTSQGTVAINAYETAEYYFGDIGEGQTDSNGVAYVGIEKLFNETVNTSIPYQVFITAYGPGNVWVEQREQDRFMVKSSQPNIKFGWEIKAKRKGYEHTRLQNVDNKLNNMAATS